MTKFKHTQLVLNGKLMPDVEAFDIHYREDREVATVNVRQTLPGDFVSFNSYWLLEIVPMKNGIEFILGDIKDNVL
jgi:hypothetical protein